MDLKSLVNDQLIFLDVDIKDNMEAIETLGQQLLKSGYINMQYIKGVRKREVEFPTGVALQHMGIAIPHATPEGNVNKNGIAVLRLEHPVMFHSMEDADEQVSVAMVMLLALKDANEHIDMLQKLFSMFQQSEIMEQLLQVSTSKKFQQVMIGALHE
jgi:PTS system galactitol-specific IIA component